MKIYSTQGILPRQHFESLNNLLMQHTIYQIHSKNQEKSLHIKDIFNYKFKSAQTDILYFVNAVFHKSQTDYSVTTVQQIQLKFHVPKGK